MSKKPRKGYARREREREGSCSRCGGAMAVVAGLFQCKVCHSIRQSFNYVEHLRTRAPLRGEGDQRMALINDDEQQRPSIKGPSGRAIPLTLIFRS